MLSQLVFAEELEYAIQVDWASGSKVIAKENVSTNIVIDKTVLHLTISSVTNNENIYFIAYYCRLEKTDGNDRIIGLSTGEADIVSISQTEPSTIDCSFNKVLELSLANKLINKDKK